MKWKASDSIHCVVICPPPPNLLWAEPERGGRRKTQVGLSLTGTPQEDEGLYKRKTMAGKNAHLPWLEFPCRRVWEASGKVCGTVGPKAPDLFLSSALFGVLPLTGVR